MSCQLHDFSRTAAEYIIWDLPADELEQIKLFGIRETEPAALAAMAQALPGPKWAFHDGERPLVVGGFIPHREGVYASWFLASQAAWEHAGREVTAMTAERIKYMLANGAHRIETVCLAKRKLAQRWYQRLGLRLESTMSHFCVDGSDAVMFVKTGAP